LLFIRSRVAVGRAETNWMALLLWFDYLWLVLIFFFLSVGVGLLLNWLLLAVCLFLNWLLRRSIFCNIVKLQNLTFFIFVVEETLLFVAHLVEKDIFDKY
jgi:hypothetical protein